MATIVNVLINGDSMIAHGPNTYAVQGLFNFPVTLDQIVMDASPGVISSITIDLNLPFFAVTGSFLYDSPVVNQPVRVGALDGAVIDITVQNSSPFHKTVLDNSQFHNGAGTATGE